MKRGIFFLILGFLNSVPAATAQEKIRDAEELGKVHFAVSCLPATQPQFDRAVAMLHSFWYPPGFDAFTEVTKSDPGCAVGYRGMARSRRGNPLVGAPSPQVLKDGLEAAEKAKLADAKT